MGFFDKIKAGLTKTREALSDTLGNVFTASEIDEDFYDELEESLILADLGMDTAIRAVTKLRQRINNNNLKTVEQAREALKDILEDMLNVGDVAIRIVGILVRRVRAVLVGRYHSRLRSVFAREV